MPKSVSWKPNCGNPSFWFLNFEVGLVRFLENRYPTFLSDSAHPYWKDWGPRWPVMCWVGRGLHPLIHSAVYIFHSDLHSADAATFHLVLWSAVCALCTTARCCCDKFFIAFVLLFVHTHRAASRELWECVAYCWIVYYNTRLLYVRLMLPCNLHCFVVVAWNVLLCPLSILCIHGGPKQYATKFQRLTILGPACRSQNATLVGSCCCCCCCYQFSKSS